MNDTRTRELYSSPNGDRWHLCKDASGRVFVLHQANIPSGGQTSQIELGDFLTRGYGPEQQALFQMIGTLIESTPGELLTGEGNPGLAVTGGSGHAKDGNASVASPGQAQPALRTRVDCSTRKLAGAAPRRAR